MLLLFVMSCFFVVGFSMKKSAEREIVSLEKRFGTSFVLQCDFDNEQYYERREIKEGYSSLVYAGPMVTDTIIEQIMEIEGTEEYSICMSLIMWVDLALRPGQWSLDNEGSPYGSLEEVKMRRQQTQLFPCSKGELDINFRTGALTISAGRNIQEGDHFKAVISEELAERNHLVIGDTFFVEDKEGIYHPSDDPFKRVGDRIELEIVGLFHLNFEQSDSVYTYEDGFVENLIYTDMAPYAAEQKIWAEMGEEYKPDEHSEVTFFVENPEKLDSVMEKVKEIQGTEELVIKVDDAAYKTSVKPFRQIRTFSNILVVAGFVGIGAVLFLLMRYWVSGRKREAGMLMSLGIGKGKIIGQMLLECLIVSGAAVILSLLLSGVLVDKCSDFAEHMTKPRENQQAYTVALNYGTNPVVEKSSSEEVKLEHRVQAEVMIFASILVCGISCFSVLLASVRILELEPKELLQTMT